ncbi:MFS transporter [Segetibacter koreensis]|uniref:MFS transporter n=1 Tax=Segetibacter koreensis TaxID=398037 RepID=UPI00037B04E0|nr:MFS transporter [Segetibacter koreensis]
MSHTILSAALPLKEEGVVTKVKTTKHLLLFAICFTSTMFGGTVSTLMSVYLPVAVKDLLGDVSVEKFNNVSAYISSVFIFGWMFGGIAWGLICDKIGRSKTVILATAFYALFTVLTGFSPSWFLVAVCRFLSGFGIGGVLVTTNILVAEAWSPKKRAVALGILSISIPVGIFSAGFIELFVSTWRQAFLIGLIPMLVAVTAMFTLEEPESRKDGSPEKDGQIVLSQKLFNISYRKDLLLGSVIFGTMLIGLWAIFSWLPTWVQSISPSNEQHNRGLSMMILGAGGLTGGFISGWIANAIGLRRTMLMCFLVSFIFSLLLFKINTAFNTTAFIELSVLALFFGISQGVLSVYIPLLFPRIVRASATGFCFSAGRLFTATVVFFVGALVSFLGGYGNAIFIFSFVFVIGFITTLFGKQNSINYQD